MARKSAAAPSPAVAEEIDLIETGSELDSALARLYADADTQPDEAIAHVYKVEADEEPKIWKGAPAEYDLEALAKRFGSGKYRLKVYVKSELGHFVLKLNKVFPYLISAEEDAKLRGIRKGEILPQSQQPQLTAESLSAALVAGLRAVLPAPVVAAPNNLGMLKEVAEIVRTLAPQPVSQGPGMLEMFRAFADIARSRDDDREPLERGVNATGTDVFLRMIDKFAPLMEKTLLAGTQTSALPAPVPGAEAGQVKDLTAHVQPGATNAAENDAMLKLKMGLGFLVMQAQADNPPETYADVVLDNVPEEDVASFLKNPDPVGYLAKVHPDVAKYSQWFTKLIDAVRADLVDDNEETSPGLERPAA